MYSNGYKTRLWRFTGIQIVKNDPLGGEVKLCVHVHLI